MWIINNYVINTVSPDIFWVWIGNLGVNLMQFVRLSGGEYKDKTHEGSVSAHLHE